jgi:hypothetical protein
VLGLYAEIAVFIGKFALRGNTLFPERAAGRKIARRNPGLGLANHEHPLSELDRRLIVLRDAIFAAGLVAVVAAIITVGGGEVFARCRERRERTAILLSLAAEVRMYLDLFIRRRAMLLRQDAWSMSASELKTVAELPSPIIFSASADLSASFGQRINR